MVFLAAKPHEENVPCHKDPWRLCVAYQKLNPFTCAFALPIPCYNDEVQDINTEAKYFISVEMDSMYWQVVAED